MSGQHRCFSSTRCTCFPSTPRHDRYWRLHYSKFTRLKSWYRRCGRCGFPQHSRHWKIYPSRRRWCTRDFEFRRVCGWSLPKRRNEIRNIDLVQRFILHLWSFKPVWTRHAHPFGRTTRLVIEDVSGRIFTIHFHAHLCLSRLRRIIMVHLVAFQKRRLLLPFYAIPDNTLRSVHCTVWTQLALQTRTQSRYYVIFTGTQVCTVRSSELCSAFSILGH